MCVRYENHANDEGKRSHFTHIGQSALVLFMLPVGRALCCDNQIIKTLPVICCLGCKDEIQGGDLQLKPSGIQMALIAK